MAAEIARSSAVPDADHAPRQDSSSMDRDVDVEVLIDGAWWPGYLRRRDWYQASEGRWACPVRFSTWESPEGSIESRTGDFDEDHVRPG